MPAPTRSDDERWMAEALALAARARGLTSPNPMVGAIVVRDALVAGRGFHARAGAPHAEIEALRESSDLAKGATLYVTLEPCNHAGRTPPCVDAILSAGIRRVVAATSDPNPRVRGEGAEALRRAGVDVFVGCLESEARTLNRVFFTAVEGLRPHVTLKCAMTLDGKIAASDRSSRWITGEAARREAHRLRSESDAIVVDSRCRLPLTARLIAAGDPGRVLVAVADDAPAHHVEALASRGVMVLHCKSRDGRVDVSDLCGRLFALDIHGVLLEGGSELSWAFLEAGLVDR